MLNTAGVNPVPFKLALIVMAAFPAPSVELVAVRRACRPPAAVGVKVTDTEQLAPPASVDAQFAELAAKSPAAVPETAKFRPDNGSPPGFVTVTVCAALATPTPTPGNVSDAGLKLSEAGANPVPETAMRAIGTPRLVLDTTTVPFCSPLTTGENVTGAVHVPPAGRLVPQFPDPTLNGDAVEIESP